MAKVDKNQSGDIDFSEFITAVTGRKRLFVEGALKDAFNYLDENKTGFIERKELKSALKGCEKKEIEQILTALDTDNDEKISQIEFITYFSNLK